jgi:hypothetical protein
LIQRENKNSPHSYTLTKTEDRDALHSHDAPPRHHPRPSCTHRDLVLRVALVGRCPQHNFTDQPQLALQEGYKDLDHHWLEIANLNGWDDGSTAVSVLIVNQTLYVANVSSPPARGSSDHNGTAWVRGVPVRWSRRCSSALLSSPLALPVRSVIRALSSPHRVALWI